MGKTELREHIIEMENSGCPEDNLFDELADNVKDLEDAIPIDYNA